MNLITCVCLIYTYIILQSQYKSVKLNEKLANTSLFSKDISEIKY